MVRLGQLDGKALEYALADLLSDVTENRMNGLHLRTSIAGETDPAALEKAITHYFSEVASADYQRPKDGSVLEARALVDRLAMEPLDSPLRDVLLKALEMQNQAGNLASRVTQVALHSARPDVRADLEGRAKQAIGSAVTDILARGPEARDEAMSDLAKVVRANAMVLPASELAQLALEQLYQADLASVLPLAQADASLGKVRGVDQNLEAAFPAGTKTVEVGGITLALNVNEDKDLSAIPTKQQSDVVLTDTVKRNLELISINWRSEKFTLLEGPTSAGKTALVRYMARMTETPYRRVSLSADTTVEDLIGRYVGGEEKYPRGELVEMTHEQVIAVANEYGLDTTSGPPTKGFFGGVKDAPLKSKSALIKSIMDVQEEPRWVDGVVVQAMKRGELVVLDEINLARPAVIGRLNELLEARGKLTVKEHEGEVVAPVEGFRIVATMNPSTDRGRGAMSAEQYDRWNPVTCHAMTKTDLSEILEVKFGNKLPKVERDRLVATHEILSREADRGVIGRRAGGLAYSLRNMEKVAQRFAHFKKTSGLDDAALMRRETQEVYRDGLGDEDDLAHVNNLLGTTMAYDGPDFYADLKLKRTDKGYMLGDVFIERLGLDDPRVPGEDAELILTPRAARVFYQMCKGLALGENVLLIGEKGGGKTCFAEMYAHLRGQPFYRQLMTKQTDSAELIGGYGENGWHDGLLLQAGRPGNKPGVALLDEYLFANTALAERLNSALDDERQVTLTEKGNGSEQVRLQEQTKIIAATNPPTKDYADRDKFSPAARNRFTVIHVPEITDPDERVQITTGIAKKAGIQEGVAEALCELHEWVNAAYKNPGSPLGKDLPIKKRPDFSMRNLLDALKTVRKFVRSEGEIEAFLKAVKSTYAARGNPEDCEAVYDKAVAMTS